MSLNQEEIRRTAQELRANLERTGLTDADVEADLGFSPERLQDTLAVRADPADVWLLRDYLEQAVRDSGAEPVPFTVLTAHSRRMARMWFRLAKAPRHRFAA